MSYIAMLALLVGGAVGFGGGWTCWRVQLETQHNEHEREKTWMWEEIRRLRTQVANIVGTEPHGVKSITEGNSPATPVAQIA